MSKVSINSDIVMRSLKIYSINGDIYVDIVGEAITDIGPANFSFPKTKLDFNSPVQTKLGAYAFMDGRGRVGYEFNFGDVLYQIPNEEMEKNDGTEGNLGENGNTKDSESTAE